jgi:hypothetical protein
MIKRNDPKWSFMFGDLWGVNVYGKSPYVFFDLQNFLLFFSSSFLPVTELDIGASGGPEYLKKSARSLVAVFERVSPPAGALACSRGLYARGASEATDVDDIALCCDGPLRVAVIVDDSVEFEALARALAAAIVSGLSIKG